MASLKEIIMFFVLIYSSLDLVKSNIFSNGISLVLTTNQPAVKNAPIGFFAHLLGINDSSPSYVYSWKCKEAGIKKVVLNQTTECNITVSVAKPGQYEMTVLVFESGQELAKASVLFNITDDINGEIQVLQPGARPRKPHIVVTKTETIINFVLHDPYDFFNDSIFYGWFINGEQMSSSEQSFNYSFTKAKNYDVGLMVSAMKNGESYYRSSLLNLQARDPIQMLNITGETSLNHSDLLDVEVACDGSSPFSYCWHFTQNAVNESAQTCLDPTMTTSCDMIIIRFFQKPGNYKLVVVIDNDVDHKVTQYNINVYESAQEPQLSPIIIPLVCICLALLIVVIGIAYYIQTRRNCSIEVADFDFQQSEVLEFQSFYERLCDTCRELCGGLRRKHKKYTYRRIQAQIT